MAGLTWIIDLSWFGLSGLGSETWDMVWQVRHGEVRSGLVSSGKVR